MGPVVVDLRTLDLVDLMKAPPDEAIWEMLTWRMRFDLGCPELAWMLVSILDTIRLERGVEQVDKLLTIMDARYNAGRRIQS